jgi:response regulator of citrate/malate metabolism
MKPDDFTLALGTWYELTKKRIPNPEGAGGKGGKIVKAQNGPQQTTAETIAKQAGVSKNTVKRALP